MTAAGKHRTVGVSFHPDLQAQAKARAKDLGLSFSRYVTLCVEAELAGKATLRPVEALAGDTRAVANRNAESSPQERHGPSGEGNIDVATALQRGGDYIERKARSIDFEDDIADILEGEEMAFERLAKVAHLRVDFLVEEADSESDLTRKIVLECSHNVRHRMEAALGQTVILKSLPHVDDVILVLPYRSSLNAHLRATFESHGIKVATPDDLLETIRDEAR